MLLTHGSLISWDKATSDKSSQTHLQLVVVAPIAEQSCAASIVNVSTTTTTRTSENYHFFSDPVTPDSAQRPEHSATAAILNELSGQSDGDALSPIVAASRLTGRLRHLLQPVARNGSTRENSSCAAPAARDIETMRVCVCLHRMSQLQTAVITTSTPERKAKKSPLSSTPQQRARAIHIRHVRAGHKRPSTTTATAIGAEDCRYEFGRARLRTAGRAPTASRNILAQGLVNRVLFGPVAHSPTCALGTIMADDRGMTSNDLGAQAAQPT